MLKQISSKINIRSKRRRSSNKIDMPPNFFDTVKPVRFMARTFGLLSFSVNYTSSGEMDSCEIRVLDVICFTVYFFMSLILSVMNNLFITPAEDIWSMVLLFTLELFFILALLLAAFCMAADIFNRHRLVALLKKINTLDKQVILDNISFQTNSTE